MEVTCFSSYWEFVITDSAGVCCVLKLRDLIQNKEIDRTNSDVIARQLNPNIGSRGTHLTPVVFINTHVTWLPDEICTTPTRTSAVGTEATLACTHSIGLQYLFHWDKIVEISLQFEKQSKHQRIFFISARCRQISDNNRQTQTNNEPELTVELLPSCPYWPCPKHRTPVVFAISRQVCHWPHEICSNHKVQHLLHWATCVSHQKPHTCATLLTRSAVGGVVSHVVAVGSAICPYEFPPQHRTPDVESSTHVCPCPAETCTTL